MRTAGGGPSSQALGKQAEQAAASFLRKNGYRIHETNFRCRFGELDIVASEGNVLVFVEVRARSKSAFGGPAESVTLKKQRRVRQAAQAYLLARYGDQAPKGREAVQPPLPAQRNGEPPQCRIDVVSIDLDSAGKPGRVEVIRDAVGDGD